MRTWNNNKHLQKLKEGRERRRIKKISPSGSNQSTSFVDPIQLNDSNSTSIVDGLNSKENINGFKW